MVATLSTVNSLLKEIYQGKITDQLQNEAVGWKRIQSTSDGVESQVGGKYVTFPVRITRNAGIGYRNELEQLQAPGQQGYSSVRVGLKYGYGRVRFSRQLIKLAQTNTQAFANAMELEMSGLKADLAKDTNRIFYGNGVGTIATATSGSGPGFTFVTTNAQYVEVGQQVDIVDPTGATMRASNRQVTAVAFSTYPAATITVDNGVTGATGTGTGNFTVTTNDIIVRTGNYGREPNGLGSIVRNTGVLFNIDPAVVSQWKAVVDSNGGTTRALSEGKMIQLTDQSRINGGKISLWLCSLGVRRAYFNLLSQQRRYPTTTNFAGGLTGLAFNNGREIPVVEDVDMPLNTMYGLEEDVFKIYQESDWEWLDEDGDVLKWIPDYDAFQAVIAKYYELGINRRNANIYFTDIIEG